MTEVWTITPDWPVRAEDPLDPELALDVLDLVSEYYSGAMESLAETVVPGGDLS